MARARYYLEATNVRVSEIARMVGFDDPFYSSRQFRVVVGAHEADERDPWTQWWVHVLGRDLKEFLRSSGLTAAQPVRQLRDITARYLSSRRLSGRWNVGIGTQVCWPHRALRGTRWRSCALSRLPERARCRSLMPRDYIIANLAEPVTVGSLAAMARMSRSHFASQFWQRVGTSPIKFQTQVRMGPARELLDTTTRSVESIAAEVGYEDAFHFSRVFRAAHDKTPPPTARRDEPKD